MQVRCIKLEGTRQVCWAPKNVSNDNLNIEGIYANDRIKLVKAVERACLRLNRPVNEYDIKDELRLDYSLILNSESSIKTSLFCAGKFFKKTVQKQKSSVKDYFYNLGTIDGNCYYYSNKFNRKLAHSFFEFYQIKNEWLELSKNENIESLESCRLPTIKAGRILLFLQQAGRMQQKLKTFLELDSANSKLASEITELHSILTKFIPKFQFIYNELNIEEFPIQTPSDKMACWTAKEMIEAFMPVYPLAPEMESKSRNGLTSRVTGILRKSIRRVASDLHSNTTADSSSPFVYDKTDALIFAGLKWGGRECRMQANYARIALGRLRDVKFVLADLNSTDFEIRMAAISCLAFLQAEEGNRQLQLIIINDTVTEIRVGALWAYAFAKGYGTIEIAKQIAENETNHRLCEFASKIAKSKFEDLWFI